MSEIIFKAVNKVYPGGHHAVIDLSLRVADGEVMVLLGPSGCGKSTVLRMVAGLEEMTSGDLWLDGELSNELSPRDRNVAMVFQHGALYPHRTVRGNLAFPLEISGENEDAAATRIAELSRALSIDRLLDRKPGSLSGGERQRVAMGRAIIREPRVFLMDEPLSNLDAGMRIELRTEISGLVRSLGVTTLYVTHDQIEALALGDRLAVMRAGCIEDIGTPQQVYDDPATLFVATFLNPMGINLVQATAWYQDDGQAHLDLGGEFLVIPRNDPRALLLHNHHGEPVTVGIRTDALNLIEDAAEPEQRGRSRRPEGLISPRDPQGNVISASIRMLEFQGHDWLAHAETNLVRIDAPPSEDPIDDDDAENARAGSHRRNDLLFRLAGSHGLRRGDKVRLATAPDRLLIFDRAGRRIGGVTR